MVIAAMQITGLPATPVSYSVLGVVACQLGEGGGVRASSSAERGRRRARLGARRSLEHRDSDPLRQLLAQLVAGCHRVVGRGEASASSGVRLRSSTSAATSFRSTVAHDDMTDRTTDTAVRNRC